MLTMDSLKTKEEPKKVTSGGEIGPQTNIKKEKKNKKQSANAKKEPLDLNSVRYRSTMHYQTTTKNKEQAKKKNKLPVPKTTNQVMQMLFESYDEKTNLLRIGEDQYSICYEYQDISFAKADAEQALSILLKWRDYLNSLIDGVHVQVINANTPIVTKGYKETYTIHYDAQTLSESEKKVAEELNDSIRRTIGDKPVTLVTKRFITLTLRANSFDDATKRLLDIEHSTLQKFKEVDSSLRVMDINERLQFLYDIFHIHSHAEDGVKDIIGKANEMKDTTGKEYSVYDVLAPKYINLRETDLIEIHESNEPGSHQKFMRTLYVAGLPTTMTPRFYNRITSIEDINSIITMNIEPINNSKFLKMVKRQITSMKTERLAKVKRAMKNGYSYELVRDDHLEDQLDKADELRNDLIKNNQKIFKTNLLVTLVADTYEELTNATLRILQVSGEMLVDLKTIKFQQLDALLNCLPLGYNTLQFQRELTSDATALNVPFNSKDIQHETGLFFGTNLVSKRGIWADRTLLVNGNGCVIATSGAGKSFNVKLQIEQILLKYPHDDVIVIDPQSEYGPLIDAYNGQLIKIGTTTDTYINPFDTDLNYGFSDGGTADPVKEKTEYIIAFCESLMQGYPLTGAHKTIIDRCCRYAFEEYEASKFQDKSKAPNLPLFFEILKEQPEPEAQSLALTLERFVTGGMSIFSHDSNVDMHNRFICFDIRELPSSIQTTGYLVVLDYIMNQLAKNQRQGKNTWIFIDEFHLLLANRYSADYIAKIYKVGRKFNAMNTVITQNIADVLNVEQGRKILSNSEFAVVLKQKPLDLPNIQDIFGISNELATYVQDPPPGQGIIVYGKDKLPFYFPVSKGSFIYRLNNTSNVQIWE